MSVDTRTPRKAVPPGHRNGEAERGTARGFVEDEDVLSTVKVPCDPAQVVVNHASFRVQLAGPVPRNSAFDTARERAAWERHVRGAARAGSAGAATGLAGAAVLPRRTGRRRPPIVWSGRTGPGDTGATRLLQAVRVPAAGAVGTALVPRPGAHGGAYGGAYGTDPDTHPDTHPAGYAGAPDGSAPGYPPGYPAEESPNASTQALPRIGGPAAPHIVGPRGPQPTEMTMPLLTGVRPVRGAYDDQAGRPGGPAGTGQGGSPASHPYGRPYDDRYDSPYPGPDADLDADLDAEPGTDPDGRPGARTSGRRNNSVRHAYYPGRRMNLGVVLLPLRIFLGFISIYAGMGKLCDPVYFDGGERGSMVTWLRSLEPWGIASPLHDFALAHPVGAGLTIAFLQVIVGVLTVCGLWQRVSASVGVLLSAALIMTVSWRTVPAYDAPDIIYLAAWSPLIIAGAPVYSVDARLAGEAWRRLGPRVEIADLRRRVLRRGAALATVVAGSALLVGALLGGAVRSSQTVTVPGPGEPPRNQLPGSALPQEPDGTDRDGRARNGRTPGADRSPSPSAATSGPAGTGESAPATPTQRQTVTAPQPSAPPAAEPPPPPPAPTAGATSGGGTPSGVSTAGTSGGDTGGSAAGGNGGAASERGGGSGGGGQGDGGGNGGALGGLLGG